MGIWACFHGNSLAPVSCAAVFFTGGNAAPDMPLGLVHVQDLLDLYVQRPVKLGQALGDVLMYCGLADAEFLRGGADSGPVLYIS